jgi:hypothetical protein
MIWLYALLLRLYPRAFYERFGAEMKSVFAQAWTDRPRGRAAPFLLWLREFSGLLLNICVQHLHPDNHSPLRGLFRQRFVPMWLLFISLLTGVLFSLTYWGYVSPPSSIISQLQRIDTIALVRLDSDYAMHVIPLRERPHLITPDFPPSQILPQLPTTALLTNSIDPALANALERDGVELFAPAQAYPTEPVVNPNGCGMNCFSVGVVPQEDGSLLIHYSEMRASYGQPPIPAMTRQLTPNDWEYYSYITPAGYIVQGSDAAGTPLLFAAIASGAFADDRYRYQEVIYEANGNRLALRAAQSYNFDIAGLEGMGTALVSGLFFALLVIIWLSILLIVRLLRWITSIVQPGTRPRGAV